MEEDEKSQDEKIQELEEKVRTLEKGKHRLTGLFRWTNKKLLGITPPDEMEDEMDPIFGQPFSLGLVRLSFGEMVLATLLTLNVASVFAFIEMFSWFGIPTVLWVVGAFYVALMFYLRNTLLTAGLVLSILPLVTIVVFIFMNLYIWIIIFVAAMIIGTVGGFVLGEEQKWKDEEGD